MDQIMRELVRHVAGDALTPVGVNPRGLRLQDRRRSYRH
jgi:hypothetical protein